MAIITVNLNLTTANIPESGVTNLYWSIPRTINSNLIGFNVEDGGSISASDTILEAFQKTQANINAMLGGVTYQGTWDGAEGSLSDGTGTKGYYYVADGNITYNFGHGAIDFKTGDWAIYNGTIWQKVDNTDAVSSVNGYIGNVVLTTDDIDEGNSNEYFTEAKVWDSIFGTSNRITVDNGSGIINISPNYVGQNTITTLGTITVGTWNGSSISTTYTDAKIKTVTGTSGRVTIGGTSTDPIFDISASYVGQTTITTLGTITSGAWQGTSISTSFTDAKIKGGISSTQIAFASGTDTITGSTSFTRSATTGTVRNVSTGDDYTYSAVNDTSTQGAYYVLFNNSGIPTYLGISGSGVAGNYTNTSIAYASSSVLRRSNTATYDQYLIFQNGYMAHGDLTTVGNIGFRSGVAGFRIDTIANLHTAATAKLHIGAGIAAAGGSPFKMTAGTVLTTPEAGTIEYITGSFVIQNDILTVGGAAPFNSVTNKISARGSSSSNGIEISVQNTSSGGGAYTAFVASNNNSVNLYVLVCSSGYSTAGAYVANRSIITTGNAAGIAFVGEGASSELYFYSGGSAAGNLRLSITSAGVLAIAESANISTGTTTGTKIGTATSQKIGFWNATPIIQPTTGVAAATFVANASANPVFEESTFDGYTIKQVVKALRNMGALA